MYLLISESKAQRTSHTIHQWFRQTERLPRAGDSSGVYRLSGQLIHFHLSQDGWTRLRNEELDIPLQCSWSQDGSIIISNVLTWLLQSEQWQLPLEELRMYDYDLRLINVKSNKG